MTFRGSRQWNWSLGRLNSGNSGSNHPLASWAEHCELGAALREICRRMDVLLNLGCEAWSGISFGRMFDVDHVAYATYLACCRTLVRGLGGAEHPTKPSGSSRRVSVEEG